MLTDQISFHHKEASKNASCVDAVTELLSGWRLSEAQERQLTPATWEFEASGKEKMFYILTGYLSPSWI